MCLGLFSVFDAGDRRRRVPGNDMAVTGQSDGGPLHGGEKTRTATQHRRRSTEIPRLSVRPQISARLQLYGLPVYPPD
jgi:hypothetical protein